MSVIYTNISPGTHYFSAMLGVSINKLYIANIFIGLLFTIHFFTKNNYECIKNSYLHLTKSA